MSRGGVAADARLIASAYSVRRKRDAMNAAPAKGVLRMAERAAANGLRCSTRPERQGHREQRRALERGARLFSTR